MGKIPWRRAWQPTPVFLPGDSYGQRSLAGYSPQGCKDPDKTELLTFLFFPSGSMVKDLPANTGDINFIPVLGRPLEEGMATHSNILAWEIPRTEEPGGLKSMDSQKSQTQLSG